MARSGRSLSRRESLVGRDTDLAVLRAFVEEAARPGAALLVTGEPGVGMSTLLEAAADMASADGMRVVRASGQECAAKVSFAGLDQVLAPQLGYLTHLRPSYRQALEVTLGMAAGPVPPAMVLANATLELLGRPAEAPGTLVVVDDLQWLDQASAEILAVVARRLAYTSVGFLAASQPSLPAVFATAGLAEHQVLPLEDGPAGSLVRARYPAVADSTLTRVLTEAQGNPLALIELPAGLTTAQLGGLAALPPLLHVTPRLAEIFSSRLDDLPTRTREVLLLAALEDAGELGPLSRASGPEGGLDELAPAEVAGLVTVDGDSHTLTFRHPVIRATMVGQSTEIERRRAHRALADSLPDQPERRAWHLAHACVHADEEVATSLEQVGHAYLARGDALGATAALTRAAELSAISTERARLLVEASYVSAVVTGQLQNSARLLDAARALEPAAAESLRAAIVAAYQLFNSECDVESAHRLLVEALWRYAGGYHCDDDTVIDALHTLFMICSYAGKPEMWVPFSEILERVAPQTPALLALNARMLGDPAYQAPSWLAHLDNAAVTLRHESHPVTITRTAIASLYLDRVGTFREALWRVMRDGRQAGAVALSVSALVCVCVDDWLTGQWDEALALAHEGVDLSQRLGLRRYAEILNGYVRPLILVTRGVAADLSATEQMAAWADEQGIGMATAFAHHVRTLSAIGDGDFEAAYHHATAISPAGVLARYTPHALWMLLDVVESAVRTGRRAQASAHVDAMRQANVAATSSRLALVAAGAAAIAADGEEATQLFEESLAVAGSERWPFDLARITLCFGEHLRQRHELVEARVHLCAAADIFERLGARPWATRAEGELRATGVSRRAAKQPRTAGLTPQELEIAQLAAEGLSNKQIARRVYLSHRTVGARLYTAFPKLGITTRAGLRDALNALRAPLQPPHG